jgi:hypothetical protein
VRVVVVGFATTLRAKRSSISEEPGARGAALAEMLDRRARVRGFLRIEATPTP